MNTILAAKNLSKSFGQVQAVTNVSFDVKQGELLGLLGPNGAGKTSVFNLLTGVYKSDKGNISFLGHDITHMPISRRCAMGMGRTFQIPRPFGDMTVYENLLVSSTFGGGQTERESAEQISDILDLTLLWSHRNKFARTLPLLDRKRLELARGLATKPKLLLLDEIAGGLSEAEAQKVLEIVKAIQRRGVSIIWIEHIMSMMEGVDRLLALAQGCTLMCGRPQAVMRSEQIMECYLGAEHEA